MSEYTNFTKVSAETYAVGAYGDELNITPMIGGTHTVTEAEATAESVEINTGLSSITGFIVQVYRANILVGSYDVQADDGTLTIATNSTDYVVTENDVIKYIAF